MANILANTDGGLLTKDNCAVVFIDHQPQITFGVSNIDRQLLVNNVVMLAKGAREYGVPVILTAVKELAVLVAKTGWLIRYIARAENIKPIVNGAINIMPLRPTLFPSIINTYIHSHMAPLQQFKGSR